MDVAIIGTGIAGLAAAASLKRHAPEHTLTLFEQNATPGGHSATYDIDYDGASIGVDTGFIVYNTRNYPLLTKLFDWLGVETQASDMSFALSLDNGRFEWCGRERRTLSGLFAQPANIASPKFYALLYEITRFCRLARRALSEGTLSLEPLGAWLARHHFSQDLRRLYLEPMAGAIWSTPAGTILDFPAHSFVQFFNNHRLLHAKRPQWRTVVGGSRRYVEKLIAPLMHRVRLDTAITHVARAGEKLVARDNAGNLHRFDAIICATHAPQALALLDPRFAHQRAVLGQFRTLTNTVYLHRDARFMPKRAGAWAAWNVLAQRGGARGNDSAKTLCVTYWMNLLQNIDRTRPLFVTLNPPRAPSAEKIFATMRYDHPQYDLDAIVAQPKLDALQGKDGLYFCGAWTGFGFHEDGLRSGLAVAALLGAQPVFEGAGAKAGAREEEAVTSVPDYAEATE